MKRMMIAAIVVVMLGGVRFCATAYAAVTITNVTCQQRYPWNGMVDIDYEIVSDRPDALFWVYPKGTDNWLGKRIIMNTLSGDGATNTVGVGKHRMVWDAKTDMPKYHTKDLQVTLQVIANAAKYLVVDVSNGPTAPFYNLRYSSEPPDLNDDTCRTDEIWLRLVLPGTFMMGNKYQVTLTKPYYMGIFEITQKQWANVVGNNPSGFKSDWRPVESVSYNDIRGATLGKKWPSSHEVDANSFMGVIRAKTSLLWDLPTEAQWEYACRAGTETEINIGKNLDITDWYTCYSANMCSAARNAKNKDGNVRGFSGGTAPVGNFLPNSIGLYDMHGNVWEWCLDYHNDYKNPNPVTDPLGWNSGDRVTRGGSWRSDCGGCTSDAAYHKSPDASDTEHGFRPVVLPFDE